MQKCYRDQNRKHGGRGLSCGGWDERFGAAIGHGYGTGGAVSNERNDGVGDIRFCRDAVSGKWAVQQTHHNENKALNHGQSHNALKRYVTFYFTNFPVQLSYFYLWKGFEVCGILEDVYVAKKRNMHGKPYGFLKFSNVKDVTKLEKALNAVSFGQFCVSASVARFDRAARERPRPGMFNEIKEKVNIAVVNPTGGGGGWKQRQGRKFP
jgi:hypothetical protein